MGVRRASRETALQFLYQDDFQLEENLRAEELAERYEGFCQIYQVNKKGKSYAFTLIEGVWADRIAIDALIEKAAVNWRLSRISPADRNIIRISTYEMKNSDKVPVQVAINEAVEISKRYCGDDSPKFINGVLDAIRQLLGK